MLHDHRHSSAIKLDRNQIQIDIGRKRTDIYGGRSLEFFDRVSISVQGLVVDGLNPCLGWCSRRKPVPMPLYHRRQLLNVIDRLCVPIKQAVGISFLYPHTKIFWILDSEKILVWRQRIPYIILSPINQLVLIFGIYAFYVIRFREWIIDNKRKAREDGIRNFSFPSIYFLSRFVHSFGSKFSSLRSTNLPTCLLFAVATPKFFLDFWFLFCFW